ncbi:PHP domain-containing protein [Nocardioides sp. Kera G14]|uniref:PHP domain-containing protein n=1 Tax=Nocardioides sp. Kera G14 TaxID=2884264 RepID=UPI001D12877A|nr:PHP domain-containing protein [Nocardioides sp. Kera G14]UDY24556.1 PHP domain-containing protein [Nocardioides sp. Kera G14]
MRIDLHTHSRVSDGTDTPTELVHAAARAGLDVIGLTDHDTTDGWAEAAVAAAEAGIGLVQGLELSTRYDGHGVHLLGYLPDPTYPPLLDELGRILEGRDGRVERMVHRLNSLGLAITVEDVRAESADAVSTGRPHVADALVRLGHVLDRDEAFSRYLGWGKPANVHRYASDLVEMIRVVTAAGGVAVIAHPWGRSSTRLTEADFAALQEIGLVGLEVDHQDHTPSMRQELRAIALNLGLVITGSSDHHGLGKKGHDLGVNTTDPSELDRLLAAAAASAVASGRRTPEMVRPA